MRLKSVLFLPILVSVCLLGCNDRKNINIQTNSTIVSTPEEPISAEDMPLEGSDIQVFFKDESKEPVAGVLLTIADKFITVELYDGGVLQLYYDEIAKVVIIFVKDEKPDEPYDKPDYPQVPPKPETRPKPCPKPRKPCKKICVKKLKCKIKCHKGKCVVKYKKKVVCKKRPQRKCKDRR